MSGPKLDTTTHDYELDDRGQPVFLLDSLSDKTSYAQAVAQRLKCRWQFIMGEWYLDQRIGTPWTQVLFRKGVTVEIVKRAFTSVALNTPGIRNLDSLEVTIDKSTRTVTISYALTMESDIIVTADQLEEPFVVDLPEVQNG